MINFKNNQIISGYMSGYSDYLSPVTSLADVFMTQHAESISVNFSTLEILSKCKSIGKI